MTTINLNLDTGEYLAFVLNKVETAMETPKETNDDLQGDYGPCELCQENIAIEELEVRIPFGTQLQWLCASCAKNYHDKDDLFFRD